MDDDPVGRWLEQVQDLPQGPAGPWLPGSPRIGEVGARRLPPELAAFVDSALAFSDERILRSGRARLAACLFVVGAADRLWSMHRLDDHRFPDAVARILERFGIQRAQAVTLAQTVPAVMDGPVGRGAVEAGGEAMSLWLSGENHNAVLALQELVEAWEREG